jgi:hypothetical protein
MADRRRCERASADRGEAYESDLFPILRGVGHKRILIQFRTLAQGFRRGLRGCIVGRHAFMNASIIFESQKGEPKRLKRLSRTQNRTPRGDVQLRAAADALIAALEQPPRDHLRLDLRRAFENVENARVA